MTVQYKEDIPQAWEDWFEGYFAAFSTINLGIIASMQDRWHDKHISAIHQWLKASENNRAAAFEWMQFCKFVEVQFQKQWDKLKETA